MDLYNNFTIQAEENNNKMSFFLSLPIKLSDDQHNYYKFNNSLIYEEEIEKIDLNILEDNLNILLEKIKKRFFKDKNLSDENFQIYDHLSIIEFNSENKDKILKFIKKFKNTKVELMVQDYKDVIDTFKDEEYPNLKISFRNSYEPISYKEFYEMYFSLNEIVDFVNHYNLSPLEKIMLVYDIVKSNQYNAESKDEDYGKSRNLNQIINGDKIVCVGFANLIDFLLKNLGLEVGLIRLGYKNKKNGHQRNYVCLKDEKYGIDGVFFLDATWDSKKDDHYLDNYIYFLKPFGFFKFINPNEFTTNLKMTSLLTTKRNDLFEELQKNFKKDPITTLIYAQNLIEFRETEIPYQIPHTLNISDEAMHDIEKEISKKYYSRISHEAFKNALYKVRKIEYMNKIIDYVPTEEHIDTVCSNYFKPTAQERLLEAIFGEKPRTPTLDKDLEESNADSVDEDLLHIRLLRALKEKLQDFPENDYIKKM